MLLAIDAIFLLILAEAIVARSSLRVSCARWLARFVAASAAIVLAAEALGLVGLISATGFLVLHGIGALAMVCAVRLRPRAAGETQTGSAPRHTLRTLAGVVKRHIEIGILALAVGLAYGINAGLVWRVPPNNWDGMMYHLSRVGYWLQQDAFYPPWNLDAVYQTAYPVNAELGLLWTVALWGSDRLAGGVQWVAALAAMVAIAGCARALGGTRPASLAASLLWATLPQPLLQSSSTQNDLVVSAFLLTAAYGLLIDSRSGNRGALLLSGVSLGLALGTKTTAQMALPPFMVMAGLVWWRARRPFRDVRFWIAASLIAWSLLGLRVLIGNWFYYGSPFGPEWFFLQFSTRAILSPMLFIESLAKLAYQLLDLAGLPSPIAQPVLELKATIGKLAFAALGLDPNRHPGSGYFQPFDFFARSAAQESVSWLGPLGALMALVVLIDVLRSVWRREAERLLLSITAIGFILVLAATLRWQPWHGRYFLLAATLCAPLMARYLEPTVCPAPLRWLLAGLAIMVMTWTVVLNESKPLAGPQPFWTRDRIALQAIQWPAVEPLLRIVEREVPSDARIGIAINQGEWDYPLFGTHFTRTILPLTAPSVLTPEWCDEQVIDFLLASSATPHRLAPALLEQHRTWTVDRWTLIALRTDGGRGSRRAVPGLVPR